MLTSLYPFGAPNSRQTSSAYSFLSPATQHAPSPCALAATIAELYDPDNTPEDLRHAHERNDEVLERIYIGRRFKNDTERLEKLFDLYTKMTTSAPTVAKGRGKASA
jgi:hypothetical protein